MAIIGLPPAVDFGGNRAIVGLDIKHHRMAEVNAGKDFKLDLHAHTLGLKSVVIAVVKSMQANLENTFSPKLPN